MRNILLNRSLSLVDKLACLYFYVASFRTLLFAGTKLWFAGVKLSFECELIRREQRKQEPLRFIHRGGAHSKITL